MNMKWFKKYVLPAVLAAAVPITANAAENVFVFGSNANVTKENQDGTPAVDFGVKLQNAVEQAQWYNGTALVTTGITKSESSNTYNTFDLSKATINIKGGTEWPVAVHALDATAHYSFGDVAIEGNVPTDFASDEPTGILFQNGSDFTGNMQGKTTTVRSTGDGTGGQFAGRSFGLVMHDNVAASGGQSMEA